MLTYEITTLPVRGEIEMVLVMPPPVMGIAAVEDRAVPGEPVSV